jgi:hypothetical protein
MGRIGRGELDGCIMHRVHTSLLEFLERDMDLEEEFEKIEGEFEKDEVVEM